MGQTHRFDLPFPFSEPEDLQETASSPGERRRCLIRIGVPLGRLKEINQTLPVGPVILLQVPPPDLSALRAPDLLGSSERARIHTSPAEPSRQPT